MKRLNSALERLGTIGVVALGLLVFEAAILLTGVLPRREQLAQAQERLRIIESRTAASPARAAAPNSVDRLLSVFPSPAGLPDEVGMLFRIAGEQQVELLQADYRLENFGSLLQVYRISLPLKASYPRVRAFIAVALNTMPYLALDSIRFERQRIDDPNVETRVNFSLFLASPNRGGSGGSSPKN